jgi:hypothetical protein
MAFLLSLNSIASDQDNILNSIIRANMQQLEVLPVIDDITIYVPSILTTFGNTKVDSLSYEIPIIMLDPLSIPIQMTPALVEIPPLTSYLFKRFRSLHTALGEINVVCRSHLVIRKTQAQTRTAKCVNQGCSAKITIQHDAEGYLITKAVDHCCEEHSTFVKVSMIKQTILIVGYKGSEIDDGYVSQVALLIQPGISPLSLEKIRHFFKKLFVDREEAKSESWKKIPAFVKAVKSEGGNAEVYYSDPQGTQIEFACMMPACSLLYMHTNTYTKQILLDGTFILSIARGTLLIIGTLMPNHSLLPIAWGWGISEN